MIKFTLFKTSKPRQFEYRPRYYDPEKEAREERRRELLGDRAESPNEQYRPGDYIRRNMQARNRIEASKERNRKMRSTPIRLLIMVVLLAIALWWILS